MRWSQLVKAVDVDVNHGREASRIEKSDIEAILDSMISIAKERAVDGDEVKLKGLGVFKVALRAETCRSGGIHGKAYVIPRRTVLILRIFRSVNAAVNLRCRAKLFADQP